MTIKVGDRQLLNEDIKNQMRITEINTYYGKRYRAHSNLIKLIILFVVPIIILAILAKKKIIPGFIFRLLSLFITIVGIVFIGYRIWDLSMRDNMDYDRYSWSRNNIQNTSPSTEKIIKTSDNNECKTINVEDQVRRLLNFDKPACSGNDCCDSGTVFDKTLNKCKVVEQFGSAVDFEKKMIPSSSCSPWDGKGQINAYDNEKLNYYYI